MSSETPCVAGCINAEFHDEYHRSPGSDGSEPPTDWAMSEYDRRSVRGNEAGMDGMIPVWMVAAYSAKKATWFVVGSGFMTEEACDMSVIEWMKIEPGYRFKSVKYVPAFTKKPKAKKPVCEKG